MTSRSDNLCCSSSADSCAASAFDWARVALPLGFVSKSDPTPSPPEEAMLSRSEVGSEYELGRWNKDERQGWG